MEEGEGLTVYVPFASGYFEVSQGYGKYFEKKFQIPGMVDQSN